MLKNCELFSKIENSISNEKSEGLTYLRTMFVN